MGFIYKIQNIINDKCYIGQTGRNPDTRWKEHLYGSQTADNLLYRAMRKYGIENFIFSVIEECDDVDMDSEEQYWIAYYDSYNNGYNLTLGGEGGHTVNYDAIVNEFTKTGTIKETARNLGVNTGTVRSVVRKCGCTTLPEPEAKNIEMIDPKTLTVIKEFSSINSAATYQEDWQRGTIKDAISGRRKSAYGYFWQEKDNPKDFSGQKLHQSRRCVLQFSKNMELLNEFASIQEANLAINKPKDSKGIGNALAGRAKTAYGYIWKYKGEE